MSNKKNGTKKKLKSTNSILRKSHVVNQSGGYNAETLIQHNVGNGFNKKNVLTILHKAIAEQCAKKIKEGPKQVLIKKAIEFEVINSVNLTKPVPSIIQNDKACSEFAEEFTDKKFVDGPETVGKNIINITKIYKGIQESLTQTTNEIMNEIIIPPTSSATPVTDNDERKISAEVKGKNAKFIAAIKDIIENIKKNEEKIKIPTVEDEKLKCEGEVFAPMNDTVMEIPKTPDPQFNPETAIASLTKDVSEVIEKYKVKQPLFTEGAEPESKSTGAVAVAVSGKDDDDDDKGGDKTKLMVDGEAFDDFKVVVIEQITGLYEWIKKIAVEGLYKFKAAMRTLLTTLKSLMFDSFPIIIGVAAAYTKLLHRCIMAYCKKCGYTISSYGSDIYKSMQMDIATKPASMTDEDFEKIRQQFGNAFVIENGKIIWKFYVIDEFRVRLQAFIQSIQEGIMDSIFKLYTAVSTKINNVVKFLKNHLSEEGMALLQKQCSESFQKICTNTHRARKKLFKRIRTVNMKYIEAAKKGALNAALAVKQKIHDGSDRALFNIIVAVEETGNYSIAETMRLSFFRMNLLTQSGYIRSLESMHERLKTMYEELREENRQLTEIINKNPLTRSREAYIEFLTRVFKNIDDKDSSFLIREAKKEFASLVNHIGDSSGLDTFNMMVAQHFGTQKSTLQDEINSAFKDQNKSPYVDLCRLLSILWDLDIVETNIKNNITNRQTGVLAVVKRVVPFDPTAWLKAKPILEIGHCNATHASQGLFARIRSGIWNSTFLKRAIASGLGVAQAYLINNLRQSPTTGNMAIASTPLVSYIVMANLIENKKLPMCVILRCNSSVVNLPLHMLSRMSTVFSHEAQLIKGQEEGYNPQHRTVWLDNFCRSSTEEELLLITNTIRTIRQRIITEICSSDEYYSRRNKIFMDAVFGSDEEELKRIYSADDEIESLELKEILKSAEIVEEESKSGTIFTIEYRYWMLLKAMQMKYYKMDKTKKSESFEPAERYISLIDEYYHEKINARMREHMSRVAELTRKNAAERERAKQLILDTLNSYHESLTHIGKQTKHITLLQQKIKSLIDQLAGGNEKDYQTIDMNEIQQQFIASLQDNTISLSDEDLLRLTNLTDSNLTLATAIKELRTQHAEALKEAEDARRQQAQTLAEAEAARRQQAQALAEAEAAGRQQDEARQEAEQEAIRANAVAAQAQRREVIKSIISDIQRDNEFLEAMLRDLEDEADVFCRKYEVRIEHLTFHSADIVVKIKAFMDVVAGRAATVAMYKNIDRFDEMLSGELPNAMGGIFVDLFGKMGDRKLEDKSDSRHYTIRDIILQLLNPLQKCERFFNKLYNRDDKSVAEVIEELDKIDEVPTQLKAQVTEVLHRGTRGGRRKNKNRSKKYNRNRKYLFTKKIKYLRKNGKKIKISARCRRK